jgi:hypothetical protein
LLPAAVGAVGQYSTITEQRRVNGDQRPLGHGPTRD